MTHNINMFKCPCCNTYMSKAMNLDGREEGPEEGDYFICANCANILYVFKEDKNISLRKANERDINRAIELDVYSHLLSVRDFILLGDHKFSNATKEDLN